MDILTRSKDFKQLKTTDLAILMMLQKLKLWGFLSICAGKDNILPKLFGKENLK